MTSRSRDLDESAGPPTAAPPLPARREKPALREPAARPAHGEATAVLPVSAGDGTTHDNDDDDELNYKVDVCGPVSYTHLTLPTILRV